MILNHNTDNRWRTPIEAVLCRHSDSGSPEYAYLSHECRSENVGPDPFGRSDSEYVGISTWDGNFILGAGSSLFRKSPKYEPRRTDNHHFVYCPRNRAVVLSFDEVLEHLQNDHQGLARLCVEFSYQVKSTRYTIYTTCRYLNFPNPELQTCAYLQPICGYVLFEEKGKFFLAYIVAYIEAGIAKTIQLRLSEQVDFFQTLSHPGKKLRMLMRILPEFLYARGFSRVVRLSEGSLGCRFFVTTSTDDN